MSSSIETEISSRVLRGDPAVGPSALIDATFSRDEYEVVRPSSAPSAWQPGSKLRFDATTFASSAYNLKESRVSLNVTPVIRGLDPAAVPAIATSLQAEQFFASTLFTSVEVELNGRTIRSLDAATSAAPFFRGWETLFALKDGQKTLGSALPGYVKNGEIANATMTDIGDPATQPNGVVVFDMHREILIDADEPFQACIDATDSSRSYRDPTLQFRDWYDRVQVNEVIDVRNGAGAATGDSVTAKSVPPMVPTCNEYYRTELLRTDTYQQTLNRGVWQAADNIQVSAPIPHSLATIDADLPGSLSLSLSFTRAPSAQCIKGSALYDAVVGSLAMPPAGGQVIELDIVVNSFELLLRRGTLAPPTAAAIISQSPSFSTPFLRMQGMVHPVTSANFSHSVTTSSPVSGIIVAFVRNAQCFPSDVDGRYQFPITQPGNPPPADARIYRILNRSIHSTGGADRIYVNSLRLTDGENRWPASGEGFSNRTARGCVTAYEHFKELLGRDVVSYMQWSNNMQAFGVNCLPGAPDIRTHVPYARGSSRINFDVQLDPASYAGQEISMVVALLSSDMLTVTDQRTVSTNA